MGDVLVALVFIAIGGACLLALFYDPLADNSWTNDYPDEDEEDGW